MWLMYWVVVIFGPHSGLVWTSTIVGWGGLMVWYDWLVWLMYWLLQWLSSQCTLCVPILGYYEMWNVQMHHNMGNICQLYIVHCTMNIVHWYRLYHGNKCGLNLGLMVSVEVYINKDVNLYWICDANNLVGMWQLNM